MLVHEVSSNRFRPLEDGSAAAFSKFTKRPFRSCSEVRRALSPVVVAGVRAVKAHKDRDVYMKFFPSDWRGDEALRNCTLAARGLWVELMCLAHKSGGYVLVNGCPPSPLLLSRQVGCSRGELSRLLSELRTHGVCSVTEDGVVYSRRMVRDAKRRETNQANGSHGGNPKLTNRLTDSDNQKPKSRLTKSDKTQSPQSIVHSPEPEKYEPPTPFERFWACYPKKVGKNDARRKFEALNADDALVTRMLDAIAWQRQTPQWQKDRGKFIPNPATWLYQHRFDDEPFNGGDDGGAYVPSDTKTGRSMASAKRAIEILNAKEQGLLTP